MATVLITGGLGLIGSHLCEQLKDKGYNVAVLSTTKVTKPGIKVYSWDPKQREIEDEALASADFIIHLAGANIGNKRWTAKRKQEIIDSRIVTAQLLFDKIAQKKKVLRAFISASAIGYYGTTTTDHLFTETDPPSNDFLGKVCAQWEQASDPFIKAGIRTVKIRTGIVLTQKGGTLSKMMTPVKMGIGSAIGNGKQHLPWIHIQDLCGIYLKAIEDANMEGAYNAVAPDHCTNQEFTRMISRMLKKPFWPVKIPALLMKLLFGEMAVVLLNGNRISSEKIKQAGYVFLFPDLESALKNVITKEKGSYKHTVR